MIVTYTFKNFKSFKEEQTVYMTPVKKITEDKALDCNIVSIDSPHNIIKGSENKLLKVAAISGQNASGKSNLIESLLFMKENVLNSFEKIDHQKIYEHSRTPSLESFMYLDSEIPSSFELSFIYKKINYVYGFELNSRQVLSEWLIKNDHGREKSFLKRKGNQIIPGNKQNIDLDITKLGQKVLQTRPHTLALSYLIAMGAEGVNGEIQDVYHYFQNHLEILDQGIKAQKLAKYFIDQDQEDLFKYLKIFIAALDTRIVNLEVSEELKQTYPFISTHEITSSDGTKTIKKIPFSKESAGTKKLLEIAIPMLTTLQSSGKVLIIDELDSSIHTNLFIDILKLFQQSNSQIIFATHNPYILESNLLRRDQIYFVDKDQYEASEIYSLSDFKGVRKDDAYQKRYLNGNYGAVPIVDFSELKRRLF